MHEVLRSFAKSGILLCISALGAVPQPAPTFRSEVEVVTVACKVVDSRGFAVGGLDSSDFRVYDNGRRRIIEHIWLDSTSPLTLGIIIDRSESQASRSDEHVKTALSIVGRLLRPQDRVFVISAGEGVRLWADLAQMSPQLEKRLLEAPGEALGASCAQKECGSSPIWDAVYDAARLRLRSVAGTKALLLLTDGFDSGSSHTWRQSADEVQRADATVYAIQYRSDLGGTFPQNLYRLLAESGGIWFQPPKGEYGPIVARMETDLRDRYVLSFRPDRLSGLGRHELQVEMNRPELTVRARNAYVVPAK